jgi:DNA repair protein RadD
MGRGMRPHPSKPNTLVLDFAGNTMRLGPVNDPVMPVKKGETAGEPPIRVCSICDTINHAASKVCKHCGFEFPPPKIKITMLADSSEIIRRADVPKIINQPVKSVLLNTHKAQSGADMIKMTIYDGNYFNDVYLTFDPVQKFLYAETQRIMGKLRFSTSPPVLKNNTDAIDFLRAYLINPTAIKLWLNKPVMGKTKKVKQILDYIYEE